MIATFQPKEWRMSDLGLHSPIVKHQGPAFLLRFLIPHPANIGAFTSCSCSLVWVKKVHANHIVTGLKSTVVQIPRT